MTNKNNNIQQLLAYWQKRLSLTDWTIQVIDDATPYMLSDKNWAGECQWVESNKQATILIVKEECYPKDFPVKYNKEQILVHELLHIYFCLLDQSNNDIQNRIVHQMIDELSKILTELHQGVIGNGNDNNKGTRNHNKE